MNARREAAASSPGEGRMRPAGVMAADAATILDLVREIVIIAGADGELLFANKAAERLLERPGPLALREGRLRGPAGAPDRTLRQAIAYACFDAGLHPRTIVMHYPDQVPLVVVVRCLGGAGRALLLAFDSHPDEQRLVGPLADCFGLTRSEAEVAAAIAEGGSPARIAARRGVAPSTVKSQIRTIAAKLGCTRQSQIAAIVKAVPLAADEGRPPRS